MRRPPKKQPGQGCGPRHIAGYALDVRGVSAFCGWTEKKTWGMVGRGLIPHRRMGGRVIFLRPEIERWLMTLSGVTLDEAVENLRARSGD